MERAKIGSELNIASATHAGMTGKHNEDFLDILAWKAGQNRKFYVGIVADGVGGQTAGEVASRLTVSTIQQYFDGLQSLGDINRHLEEAILAANQAVYRASQKNSEYQGMSTTIAIVAMIDKRLYTAHVGDSRIYLLRGGQLLQISIDHTWAQEAIDAGLLTAEQAKIHPNRNVIRRHLGGANQVEVDHRLNLPGGESKEKVTANQGTSLKSGDTILICSDGLSDMINDGAILDSLQNHFQELPVAADELVDKANRAGGKDNITIVLMQIPGVAGAVAPVVPPVAAVVAGTATRAKATTTATKTGVYVASTSIATSQTAPAKSGVGRLTWILVGGAILFFLVILAAGIVLVVGNSMRSGTTPEATTDVPAELPEATLPVGAPATAAILATAQSATGTADSAGPVDTPGLIPTLRSTVTKTPIIRATLARTSTPEPVATNTPSSSGSSGSSGGSSGESSGSKPPTPKPPTAEPPTVQPPTAEPPTAEPPTEEPPTEEPPTEEPPTDEPPTEDPPTEEPPTEEPPTVEP